MNTIYVGHMYLNTLDLLHQTGHGFKLVHVPKDSPYTWSVRYNNLHNTCDLYNTTGIMGEPPICTWNSFVSSVQAGALTSSFILT